MVKYIKQPPSHESLHREATKIANLYLKISVFILFYWIVFDLVILLTKNTLKEFGKDVELTDWNRFFALEEWVQWTALGCFTGRAFLFVLIARLLKFAVEKESTLCLKLWFPIFILDFSVTYSLVIAEMFIVSASLTMVLGIVRSLTFFIECYFIRALLKYYKSLQNGRRHEPQESAFSPSSSNSTAIEIEVGNL